VAEILASQGCQETKEAYKGVFGLCRLRWHPCLEVESDLFKYIKVIPRGFNVSFGSSAIQVMGNIENDNLFYRVGA
jgi:hypothetical protein